MTGELKFPQVIGALARVEGTVWGVADALVAEVRVTKGGVAMKGQYEAISKEAAEHGYVNPTSGRPYNAEYFGQLRETALFANAAVHEGVGDLREYPVQRVREAKAKAKSDLAKTAEILRSGQTTDVIRGKSSRLDTPEQAKAAVKAASTEARKALVDEAMNDPDVVAAVAANAKTRTAISEAAVDQSVGRSTEQKERAAAERKRRKREEAEEKEDTATRPGLTFLAAGSALYRARLSVIEAMGHIREGDVTDSVRELLNERIASMRELLTDLQLLAAGEKEITDEDIHAFLAQAEEDNAEAERK